MSIRLMTDVWDHGPDGQGELLVLLALADFANDAGMSWPTVSTLAKRARMSERNARRVLRKLEELGYVSTEPQRGRNYQNLYVVNRDALKPDNLSGRTFATVKPDIAVSAEPSRTTNNTPLTPLAGGDGKSSRRFVGVPDGVLKLLGEMK